MVGLLIEFPLTYRPLTTIILYHTFKKMSIVKLHKLSQIFGTVFVQFDGAPGPRTHQHMNIYSYVATERERGLLPSPQSAFVSVTKYFTLYFFTSALTRLLSACVGQ